MLRSFTAARPNVAALIISLILSLLAPSSGAFAAHQPESVAPVATATRATAAGTTAITVAFEDAHLSRAEAAAILARQGMKLDQWLPGLGLARALLQPQSGAALSAALSALEQDARVAYATEERRSVEAADIPGDEYWGQQWGPAKVGLPAARDVAWGDASVVVAVVDSGVNYFHWDLRDQMWVNPGESEIDPATGKRTCNTGIAKNGQDDDDDGYADDCRGYNFDAGTNDPADTYGHGTAVAGIASAATNNPGHYTNGKLEGIAGMGGAAAVMPLRALNEQGLGSPFNIAEAIRYAADRGARVVNLSLTLPVNYNPDDAATLCRATDYAQGKGSLVVGASGNHSNGGLQPVSYPAACPGVLSVGASTKSDTRAAFSDGGSRLDLVAPGEGILSTLRATNTSYGLFGGTGNGTSFAAPHAAGAAALVRALRPDLSPPQVIDVLKRTADDVGDPGVDDFTGSGRLNLARAMTAALDSLSLRLVADPPAIAALNSTVLHVEVRGPAGQPVGRGARINLVSALGVVSPTVVTADGAGGASATFTAGATVGAGSVTAALGPISVTLPITVSSGVPAAMRLVSDPPRLPTNGRATVTATVLDDSGNPIGVPLDVTFAATLGSVDPLVERTKVGQASTVFAAGPISGTAKIEASTGGITMSLDIPVLGAGQPFTLTLGADPAAAQAGGPPSTLTASVLDLSGRAVDDGTVVAFSTDLGELDAATAATKNGLASVKLNPGTVTGTARLTAKVGLLEAAVALPVVAGPPVSVTAVASPQELVAGFNQLATITAVARDAWGNVAADGVTIHFSTTLGQLVSSSAPVEGGQSQVQLVGGTAAGTAQVTATAPSGAHATTEVLVKPADPGQIALAAQPPELLAGGGASRIRATIKDAYGNLVRSGIPVTLTTDLGLLQPPGGGQGGLSFVTVTNGGVAEADIVPGTAAGVAYVHATVGADLRQTLLMVVQPAGPAQLQLSAEPLYARPGGRVDIAARTVDAYGNAVADGVNITFGVSRGQLYQSVVPTVDGYASTWFTAPSTLGPVQVVAISGGVSALPLTVQVVRPLYLPLLNR